MIHFSDWVNLVSGTRVYGALFAGQLSSAGDVTVHHDRSIVRAGERCTTPTPPVDAGVAPDGGGGCRRCGDCRASEACVEGRCGACRTDADCCAPLVCDTRTGACGAVPP